nr:methyltransferase domain-containing protein [Methanosarcina horonobensis]
MYKGDAVLLDKEKENSFDAIVSRDVVWTLYDPEKAFMRWKNLLKPGVKSSFMMEITGGISRLCVTMY